MDGVADTVGHVYSGKVDRPIHEPLIAVKYAVQQMKQILGRVDAGVFS
jgi:hypothetical protein